MPRDLLVIIAADKQSWREQNFQELRCFCTRGNYDVINSDTELCEKAQKTHEHLEK